MRRLALALALTAVACGAESPVDGTPADAGATSDAGTRLPDYVTVELLSATIAPCKSDRTTWDGLRDVPATLVADLATSLGAPDAFGAVGKLLASTVVAGYDKPDPFGTMQAFVNGQWSPRTIQLPAIQDTFTPTWTSGHGWRDVPFNSSLRIRVQIFDEDALNHDPIGTAEVGYADLVAVLEAGNNHHVQVNGQTQDQLLFLGFSVLPQ